MPLDPLSPIAPARVRVLLLPVGRIRRSRFQTFVTRLEPQFVVRLGDVSPDGRPDRSTHSFRVQDEQPRLMMALRYVLACRIS